VAAVLGAQGLGWARADAHGGLSVRLRRGLNRVFVGHFGYPWEIGGARSGQRLEHSRAEWNIIRRTK